MTRSGKAPTGNVHDAVRSGAPPVWPRLPRTPRGCRVRRISDGARDGARDGVPGRADAGRKAFHGKTQASLIRAILKDAPAPMAVRRTTFDSLRLQRYSIPKRRSTRAPTAPSNSGSVQINAVAIRRSETTSQTPRSPEWAMGVGSIDIHAPRLMPRVIAARTNRKSRIQLMNA